MSSCVVIASPSAPGLPIGYNPATGTVGGNSSGTTIGPGNDLNNLPLNSGAGAIFPSVAPILPCPVGQTCSYLANIPDWVIWLGLSAIVVVPLLITGSKR
jgi:hypothetical protein